MEVIDTNPTIKDAESLITEINAILLTQPPYLATIMNFRTLTGFRATSCLDRQETFSIAPFGQ